MEKFIEVEASLMSFRKRKKLYGVGVNDAWYITKRKGIGTCPYYKRWTNMLTRCYRKEYKEEFTTYQGCTVTEEWLLFSNFRAWMETQEWEGKQLDKDLLGGGVGKNYSPASCSFLSPYLNSLIIERREGPHPAGVSWYSRDKRFVASCRLRNSTTRRLGYFKCVNKAELAYVTFKAEVVAKAAHSPEALADSRLTPALLRHAAKFTERAKELNKLIANNMLTSNADQLL